MTAHTAVDLCSSLISSFVRKETFWLHYALIYSLPHELAAHWLMQGFISDIAGDELDSASSTIHPQTPTDIINHRSSPVNSVTAVSLTTVTTGRFTPRHLANLTISIFPFQNHLHWHLTWTRDDQWRIQHFCNYDRSKKWNPAAWERAKLQKNLENKISKLNILDVCRAPMADLPSVIMMQ